MAGLAELLDRLAEGQVGRAAETVEGVEVTAGDLDRLERLGQLAERGDRLVADTLGALVLREWAVGRCRRHRVASTRPLVAANEGSARPRLLRLTPTDPRLRPVT